MRGHTLKRVQPSMLTFTAPIISADTDTRNDSAHDYFFAEARKGKRRPDLKTLFLYGHRAQRGSWIMSATVEEFARVYSSREKIERYIAGPSTRTFIIAALKRRGFDID